MLDIAIQSLLVHLFIDVELSVPDGLELLIFQHFAGAEPVGEPEPENTGLDYHVHQIGLVNSFKKILRHPSLNVNVQQWLFEVDVKTEPLASVHFSSPN